MNSILHDSRFADIFAHGLCRASDNKMTPDQQDVAIDIIHRCFRKHWNSDTP